MLTKVSDKMNSPVFNSSISYLKKAITGTLLICLFFSADNCKKKYQPEYDKINASSINRSINELLTSAESSTDDNEKAKFLGKASTLLIEKQDYKQAAEIARKALEANPTNPDALASLGEYYTLRNMPDETIYFLNGLVGTKNANDRIYYLLGNAFYMKGSRDKAVTYYHKAIDINENNTDALNNLSVVYTMMHKPEKAYPLALQTIKIKPENGSYYKNCGIIAEKLKRNKEAVEYYKHYLDLNSNGDDRKAVEQWIKKLNS